MGKARGWGPRQQAPAVWGWEWGIPKRGGQFPSSPHWLQHKLGPTTADGETGYPSSSQARAEPSQCGMCQAGPGPTPSPSTPLTAAPAPLPRGWRQGRAGQGSLTHLTGGVCPFPGGRGR